MTNGNREPRTGEVVLARAAASGVMVGAFLGALVMLPDLLAYLRADDADLAYLTGPSGLLLGAGFGALVGLVSAVAAAAAWLLTVEGPPPRPRLSRVMAAVVAAVVVLVAAFFSGPVGEVNVVFALVAGGFAVVAGALAAGLAPTIGYRPRHGER